MHRPLIHRSPGGAGLGARASRKALATLAAMSATATSPLPCIAFIGGGNMASALIGGLRQAGHAADRLVVVEPHAEQRQRLAHQHGVQALAEAGAALAGAQTVVWAVKPQLFAQAGIDCLVDEPDLAAALALANDRPLEKGV